MRNLACWLALALLLGVLSGRVGHGQEPKKAEASKPDPKKVKVLMHRKLDSSQKLLEALAVGDLGNAGTHAEALLRISKEAEWKVHNTREFDMWSDEFRQNAEAVVKASKEKNQTGAVQELVWEAG